MIGFFFIYIDRLFNDWKSFWLFLENFDIKLNWIYSVFNFFSLVRIFGIVENLLRFSLIFVRECFWFINSNEGKKVKLFFEKLSVKRFFRFLNRLLEIEWVVLFKLMFKIYKWWRLCIFWNILECIWWKLFFDKLSLIKFGKLSLVIVWRGKLVFWRYSFFSFFFINIKCRFYLFVLWK